MFKSKYDILNYKLLYKCKNYGCNNTNFFVPFVYNFVMLTVFSNQIYCSRFKHKNMNILDEKISKIIKMIAQRQPKCM